LSADTAAKFTVVHLAGLGTLDEDKIAPAAEFLTERGRSPTVEDLKAVLAAKGDLSDLEAARKRLADEGVIVTSPPILASAMAPNVDNLIADMLIPPPDPLDPTNRPDKLDADILWRLVLKSEPRVDSRMAALFWKLPAAQVAALAPKMNKVAALLNKVAATRRKAEKDGVAICTCGGPHDYQTAGKNKQRCTACGKEEEHAILDLFEDSDDDE
jgi:hypothetical protein